MTSPAPRKGTLGKHRAEREQTLGMLLGLHIGDYGVLATYVAVLLAIAVACRRQQGTGDFFLARRRLGGVPLGLSLLATLMGSTALLSYPQIPGDAYYLGLQYLLVPLGLWLTFPLIARLFVPLYRNLELTSVYEYLELRFDRPTRIIAAWLYLVWRFTWTAGLLFLSAHLLDTTGVVPLPELLLILLMGLLATAIAMLGGLRAIVWCDVVQASFMIVGVAIVLLAIIWQLDQGSDAIWSTAQRIGRTQVFQTSNDLSELWNAWVLLPGLFFLGLAHFITDQALVQHVLAGRSETASRQGVLISYLSLSLLTAGLMAVGLGLLAFYQQNPDAMRPIWVVNLGDVDHRESLLDSETGQPLIDWEVEGPALDPGQVDATVLDQLLASGRLKRPNSKDPFQATAGPELLDSETQSLRVARLAMRRGGQQGEWVLNRRAQGELLAHFIRSRLPWGVRGLLVIGLLAAALSTIDSGLQALTSVVSNDLLPNWTRAGSTPAEPASDSAAVGKSRLLAGMAGALTTVLAIAAVAGFAPLLLNLAAALAAPLTAVFLLGAITRQANGRAMSIALILGTVLTLWVLLANQFSHLQFAWPLPPVHPFAALPLGVAATFVLGGLLSLLTGRRRYRDELRGLVWGEGKLGVREPEEASIEISNPLDDDRWK